MVRPPEVLVDPGVEEHDFFAREAELIDEDAPLFGADHDDGAERAVAEATEDGAPFRGVDLMHDGDDPIAPP